MMIVKDTKALCTMVNVKLDDGRMRYITMDCRSIMRGTLQALAFCHSRSVAHGSMGSGSVLLSTFDDRRANDLIVKLDNFGFGRAHYACSLDLKGGECCNDCCCSSVHDWVQYVFAGAYLKRES